MRDWLSTGLFFFAPIKSQAWTLSRCTAFTSLHITYHYLFPQLTMV